MDKHRCGTFPRIESTGNMELRLTRSTNSPGESLIQSACPDLLNLHSTIRGEAKRAKRKPSAAANTMACGALSVTDLPKAVSANPKNFTTNAFDSEHPIRESALRIR